MDVVAAAYYALVCALLSGLMPARIRPPIRFAVGAAVGIGAASLLPVLRGLPS